MVAFGVSARGSFLRYLRSDHAAGSLLVLILAVADASESSNRRLGRGGVQLAQVDLVADESLGLLVLVLLLAGLLDRTGAAAASHPLVGLGARHRRLLLGGVHLGVVAGDALCRASRRYEGLVLERHLLLVQQFAGAVKVPVVNYHEVGVLHHFVHWLIGLLVFRRLFMLGLPTALEGLRLLVVAEGDGLDGDLARGGRLALEELLCLCGGRRPLFLLVRLLFVSSRAPPLSRLVEPRCAWIAVKSVLNLLGVGIVARRLVHHVHAAGPGGFGTHDVRAPWPRPCDAVGRDCEAGLAVNTSQLLDLLHALLLLLEYIQRVRGDAI